MFRVDFEKAYDMVNYEFIYRVMGQMGLPALWWSQIIGCASSTIAYFWSTGLLHVNFGSKVLRRDSLSHFIFYSSYAASIVSIRPACSFRIYKGVQLPNGGPMLSHSLYADDALFMGKWSMINARNLFRMLKWFHMESRLKVNFYKTLLLDRYFGC